MTVIDKEEAATKTVAEAVNQLLAHYIGLAKQTAWKAYAWHRVQEMAKDCPALYAELPQRLTAAMLAQASCNQHRPAPAEITAAREAWLVKLPGARRNIGG